MDNKTFNQITEQFFQECLFIMNTKGIEYSGEEDKFANFKRLANMQGIPVESIWLTYFVKHFDSIVSFIRKVNNGKNIIEIEKELSEPIRGRIMDMINYLLILNGIIEEKKFNEKR